MMYNICNGGINMPRKSTRITEIKKMLGENANIIVEQIEISSLRDIRIEMKNIDDIRHQSYVRHNLIDIVMLALIAVLAGADEWIEMEEFGKTKKEWLKTFLDLPNGIPSHDTIQRVFTKIKSSELHNCCINFLLVRLGGLFEISKSLSDEDIYIEKDIRAIDGKCSRGSHKNITSTEEIKAIHTLNMFSQDCEMCVSQVFVEEKSNEIPASKDILDIIDVENCIITCDALNTQKTVIEKIVEHKGDYVCALKGNQENFLKDVQDYFEEDVLKKLRKSEKQYYEYSSKENSNIVTRRHYIETDIEWLEQKSEWKNINAIGLVHKIIEKVDNTKVEEKRYYICSISEIQELARCTRGHWGVENKLHWQLDYTFRDDKNTTVEKNSAKNIQILKKVALSLLNIAKPAYKTSLKNMRKRLGWNFEIEIENLFKLLNVEAIRNLLIK